MSRHWSLLDAKEDVYDRNGKPWDSNILTFDDWFSDRHRTQTLEEDARGRVYGNGYTNRITGASAPIPAEPAPSKLNGSVMAGAPKTDIKAEGHAQLISEFNTMKRYYEQTHGHVERLVVTDMERYDIDPFKHTKINNITGSGKAYVLFGRPDFNIFKRDGSLNEDIQKKDPLLYDKLRRDPSLVKLLDMTNGDKSMNRHKRPGENGGGKKIGPYLSLFTNLMTTFNMPDVNLSVTESNKSLFDAKVVYPLHDHEGLSNASISISFFDTKDRDLYHLLDA